MHYNLSGTSDSSVFLLPSDRVTGILDRVHPEKIAKREMLIVNH